MVLGVVINLAVLILLRTSLIDTFIKGIIQPQHNTLLYCSAPVQIIPTVIRMKEKKGQNKQEGDTLENVTEAKEAHNLPTLTRVARQPTIPLKSEDVVLATVEARRLVQIDELLNWDFIHARKTRAGIMDVF